MASTMKLFLVEDDVDLREGLEEALALEGLPVIGLGSTLDFYRALAQGPCDVAVIDLTLPDGSGLELVEHLRAAGSTRIIVLTARGSVQAKIAGYGAGADLYLVKPVDARELAAAVRSLAGRAFSAPEPPPATWRLDRAAWALVAPNGRSSRLTAKELKFLDLLVAGEGAVVSRAALTEALGYFDDASGQRALDALVLRLRRKLESALGEVPLRTAHGEGYAFPAHCR